MKIAKKILSIIAMLAITILGMFTIWGISIRYVLSPKEIISSMDRANYATDVEKKLKSEFKYYLDEEKTQDIFVKAPIKENIKYILSGVSDQSVEEKSENVKQEVKNIIYRNLSELVSTESAEIFSKNMSEKYIKTILPVSQINKYSKLYVKYIGKLNSVIICSLIITLIIIVIVFLDKESIRFGVISLYNIIIMSVPLAVVILTNSNIALGSIRKVVQQILYGVVATVGIQIGVIILALAVINYLLYFRKKNK